MHRYVASYLGGVEIPQTNGMAVMRNLELAESTLLSSLNSFEYKIDDIEKNLRKHVD